MLRSTKMCRALAIGLAIQITLVASGLPGFPCPIHDVFGLPCPGCGLTRACTALVHGDFIDALRRHAFSPVVAMSAIAFVLLAVSPAPARARVADTVERLERRYGLSILLFVALVLYWLARLVYCPADLIRCTP
jgi:hypothetical protein